MIKKKLEEYLDYKQPQPYIVSNEQYSNEYKTPVLTAGKSFLLGMTNDTKGIYPASKDEPIILFDDFTTDIKWVDFPFKVKSSACKILVPRNGTNLRFCYYGMKSLNFDASQHKRYWISQYSQMQLPDYPNARKAEIVERLSRIESQINIKENQLNKLDSLVKSRFMEMFGDPISNSKQWPTEPLSECCQMNGIKKYPKQDKYWILNLDRIESGTGAVLAKDYASIDMVGNSTFFFDESYVLYSKLRPYLNKVALPDEPGFATTELVPLKPASYINRTFLATLLRTESFVAWIDSTSSGAKMPRASVDSLGGFKAIIPPITLQNDFANFVNLIDKSRFVVQSQIKDLQELLDSKMDEYFGGDNE